MDLLKRAALRRTNLINKLDAGNQVALGQFFTPPEVARSMALLAHLPERGALRVLDPGAGTGVLSAAIIEHARAQRPDLKVELTAVEADTNLLPALSETLQDCERIGAHTRLANEDFVDWALRTNERFNLVIQNPPYKKIQSGSRVDNTLKAAGITVPNIYAGFMALGSSLLLSHGQQISITPRSWMNGTYFSAFRKALLGTMGIDAIYIFESRSEVFRDLGVLQETIIVSSTKGTQPKTIRLLSSPDHRDTPKERHAPASEVITEDFIFVPASDEAAEAVSWMANARHTLATLGLSVSTGRVVDFRSREHLTATPVNGATPMVYPAHLAHGSVIHPKESLRKPQWFKAKQPSGSKLLLPPGTYVLIKRFSTKEERRRLVAAIWSDERPPAFDNKLNYIHRDGNGLNRTLANGLAAWLNSKHADDYFRVFSGHTQVNAGDLRSMRFPSLEQLLALGHSPLDPDEAIERIMIRKTVAA